MLYKRVPNSSSYFNPSKLKKANGLYERQDQEGQNVKDDSASFSHWKQDNNLQIVSWLCPISIPLAWWHLFTYKI